MLEPCEGKLSRTVLRGESGSNTADLLDQTVENKQKFISQIMTSKSPVRSCEDVDATALSFAEIKALCAGDPRIKERMDLDIEVSKLKIVKADHNSKQFRLEDSLLKYFPKKIEEYKGFVRGLEADMQTLVAHPLPAEGFVGMEIRGDRLTDKENAGAALLDTCKEVKGKKVPSLLGGEQKKSIRMDTLGDGYTPADLRAVIAGEKAHTPQKNAAAPVKPEKRSGNLLVDIQAKLRAGKGAGYARWATLFNLKQMAQTVAYLQDHELLDYAVLSEKAAAASAHFNELSARIKAAETRMAEIAVLREHIVNYAKTRDTYVAYRKAGYSKKFLAEHESEITIHKAAKNYFDGLGFKKLPTIKALNTEYAELLAEKKAAYTDYRKAREKMKELLTAKANIDRILELDKEQEEVNERREKEAEQR